MTRYEMIDKLNEAGNRLELLTIEAQDVKPGLEVIRIIENVRTELFIMTINFDSSRTNKSKLKD